MASLENEDLVGTKQIVIDKDFLMKALNDHGGSWNIVIKDFTVSEITKSGDNFATEVVSVTVDIEQDGNDMTMHLIIKLPWKNLTTQEAVILQRRLFHSESAFYRDVIPAMIELQIKHGLKPFGPPVPQHIYSSVNNAGGIIVLEDLRPQGYKMSSSTLNYERCKLVMEELAKFHALSSMMKNGSECNLQKFETALNEIIWAFPINDILIHAFKLSMKCIKSLTSSENIVTAANKLENSSLQDLMAEQLQPIEPHALICHGDSWRNNVLFKCELIDGVEVPVGAKLLDFQLCRYALPTTDLSFFLYTSTTRELRETRLHDLLRLYHESFAQCTESFNVDHPEFPFEELKKLYKQTALYGMLCFYSLVPFVFMMSNNFETFNDSVETAFLQLARSMEHTEAFSGQRFLDPIEEMISMDVL